MATSRHPQFVPQAILQNDQNITIKEEIQSNCDLRNILIIRKTILLTSHINQ